MSHPNWLSHPPSQRSVAQERPLFFAPRAWSAPLPAPAGRLSSVGPSRMDYSAPLVGGQENVISFFGKLLVGLAIGGFVYHLLDDLLSSPRRPHLEAWKREYVFDRDRGHCAYCGIRVTWARHHIDHKIALACGGSNEVRNLALSCKPCNLSKGTLSAREFRRYLNYIDPLA